MDRDVIINNGHFAFKAAFDEHEVVMRGIENVEIRDGIVYGGEPEKPIKIVDVKVLPDMMLLLRFNNEELRLFDAALLEGPVFEPLHDEKVFSKPVIDHGVITWLNGAIDCAPEYMYEHSYPQSREFAALPQFI